MQREKFWAGGSGKGRTLDLPFPPSYFEVSSTARGMGVRLAVLEKRQSDLAVRLVHSNNSVAVVVGRAGRPHNIKKMSTTEIIVLTPQTSMIVTDCPSQTVEGHS